MGPWPTDSGGWARAGNYRVGVGGRESCRPISYFASSQTGEKPVSSGSPVLPGKQLWPHSCSWGLPLYASLARSPGAELREAQIFLLTSSPTPSCCPRLSRTVTQEANPLVPGGELVPFNASFFECLLCTPTWPGAGGPLPV